MKSFLIEDILVTKATSHEGASAEKCKIIRGEHSILGRDIISSDDERSSASFKSTGKDWIKTEKEDFHPCHLPTISRKVDNEIEDVKMDRYWHQQGRYSQYSGGMLPYYSPEHLQQNRGVHKHFGGSNVSPIYQFPLAYHHALPRGSSNGPPDFAYVPQGFPNHFGVPLPNVAGDRESLFQNGQYTGERIHYPVYSLTRPLYSSNCKRKGGQIRFNNSQTGQLEKAFVQQKYLNATDRKKLATSLGLTDRQVKTWFQNRRAKLRKSKGMHCAGLDYPGSPEDHHPNGSPIYDDSPDGIDSSSQDIKINID